GADGGDLITAAATGGIPHPTGYPLYVLLARFFQLLPVGTLAFRTNLMSALLTALSAGLIYSILSVHVATSQPPRSWMGPLAGGFALSLGPLALSPAVIRD